MTAGLQALGHRVSEAYVARRMHEMGLLARQARKRTPKTMQTDTDKAAFPDLIQRDFTAAELNQRWVGEITYLPIAEGCDDLATVVDLHSRKVVGGALGSTMEAE